MGFGILVFGYFLSFAFAITRIYYFVDLVGAVLMFISFYKLKEYNRYFIRSIIFCVIFFLACVTNASAIIFKIYDNGSVIDLIIKSVRALAACILTVYALLGTRGIALGAGEEKIANRARSNIVMTIILYILVLAYVPLNTSANSSWIMYFMTAMYFYGALCIFMNLYLFYKCYAKLIPADSDDEVTKTSKFGFINFFNKKFDELELKKDKYRRDSMKLALDEADKNSHNTNKGKRQRNKNRYNK